MRKIISREATYNVKGTEVTFLEKIMIDIETGEEIFDEELEQKNDVRLYNEYRKLKGLLLPEKIKEIRKKFGVTQTVFAKVLGLGDKTIARYENGSLQDMAQNNLIKSVHDNPIYFLILMKNCQKLQEELGRKEFNDLVHDVNKKIKLMRHFKLDINLKDYKINTFKKYEPKFIAGFILKNYNYTKLQEMISPLKLQKLLSYIYSYLLAFEYKIFDENPQAWVHGPVFKSVYDEYSKYGYNSIEIPKEDFSLHEEGLEKFILKVAESYGAFTAKELENQTHKEDPWIFARERAKVDSNEPCNEIILDEDIKEYFKKLLCLN